MSYGRETVRAFVWGGDGASLACLSTYVCLARRLWLQPVLARAAQQAMQQHFAGVGRMSLLARAAARGLLHASAQLSMCPAEGLS